MKRLPKNKNISKITHPQNRLVDTGVLNNHNQLNLQFKQSNNKLKRKVIYSNLEVELYSRYVF